MTGSEIQKQGIREMNSTATTRSPQRSTAPAPAARHRAKLDRTRRGHGPCQPGRHPAWGLWLGPAKTEDDPRGDVASLAKRLGLRSYVSEQSVPAWDPKRRAMILFWEGAGVARVGVSNRNATGQECGPVASCRSVEAETGTGYRNS